MAKIFIILLLATLGLKPVNIQAQVAISSTVSIADPSAMLDVKSNTNTAITRVLRAKLAFEFCITYGT